MLNLAVLLASGLEAGEIIGIILLCVLLLFLLFAPIFICSSLAVKRGKSGCLWAFLGFMFGWIGVLIVACLKKEE